MFKTILRKIMPNPLDKLLKNAKKNSFKNILLFWNRGVGDIPLGLSAIVHRINSFLPNAKISFLVRGDLKEGFLLLPNIDVHKASNWVRGKKYKSIDEILKIGKTPKQFDLIIDYPDPTYWVKWQLGKFVPKLNYNLNSINIESSYMKILEKNLDKKIIGIQPSTETTHGYFTRNWPVHKFQETFKILEENNYFILLFGFEKGTKYDGENILDFRGKTNLLELLCLIKKYCKYLLLPDSGILSIVYFFNENFPINIVSLWGDPNQGILKQNVKSPNALLKNSAIIAKDKKINKISVTEVLKKIDGNI